MALVNANAEKAPGILVELAKLEFSESANNAIVENAKMLAELAVRLDLESIKVGAIEICTRRKVPADLSEISKGSEELSEEERDRLLYHSA